MKHGEGHYMSGPLTLTAYEESDFGLIFQVRYHLRRITLGSTTTIHRSGVIIIIGHDPRSGITRATTSANLGVVKFRTALVWVEVVMLILTAR